MLLKITILLTFLSFVQCQSITISMDGLFLNIFPENNKLMLYLYTDEGQFINAEIGVGLNIENLENCVGVDNCLKIGDVRLHVLDDIDHSFNIYWTTKDTSKVLTDCFALNKTKVHWFGGPERYHQSWPIEKLTLNNFANVIHQDGYSSVAEPYWLNSLGYYIHVDSKTPLFVDQNSVRADTVCFVAKQQDPYRGRSRILLQYTLAKLPNPREAHLHAVNNFLGKPTGHPNNKMIERPIWSTWARYKTAVSDEVCLKFADEIVENGYSDGQFELDDKWESCYGSLEFRTPKFENITDTVKNIKDKGFRFTVWVHPFVNTNCENFSEVGNNNDYFIKNTDGSALTSWWNSGQNGAQIIDFSNEEARHWYTQRLKALRNNHGVDSFKFDAGETNWTPQLPVVYGDVELIPNSIVTDYVRTCAQLGDLIEVRSAYNTQDLPVFVRMMDKDSRWGNDNGLYTLITTLLQMNMNGYSMVLPDMIGGNGYGEPPSAELFVRWLQANTFMPSIQFSFVPWDYLNEDIDVVAISKKFVDIHQLFSSEIIKAMNNSIHFGNPVNAPVWWIDPINSDAHSIDTQYLLGEDIVVAPVVIKGATTRDVFLPEGTWIDGTDNKYKYEGPTTISDYPAPIEVLPHFIRKSSEASKLLNNI